MTNVFRLCATVGALGFAFGAGLIVGKGFLTSNSGPEREIGVASDPQGITDANEEADRLEPQIADAIQRWSLKSRQSKQRVRKRYQPRSMFIPTRNQGQGMLCIELRLRLGHLGGSPVYCYQDDFSKPDERTKLVAEYSDVE